MTYGDAVAKHRTIVHAELKILKSCLGYPGWLPGNAKRIGSGAPPPPLRSAVSLLCDRRTASVVESYNPELLDGHVAGAHISTGGCGRAWALDDAFGKGRAWQGS